MTEFLILRASEPNSIVVQDGDGAEYLFSGSLREQWIAGESTQTEVDVDGGTGAFAMPDFIALAGIDAITTEDSTDITVEMWGDTTAAFAAPVIHSMTFGTDDLLGPQGNLYVEPVTAFVSNFRYWRLRIETTDSVLHKLSKWYFGTAFDFGGEPVYTRSGGSFNFDSRSFYQAKRQVRATWVDISPAKMQEFERDILRHSDVNPVFLWDKSDHFLDGDHLLFCEIISSDITIDQNERYSISATFEELE